MRLYPLKRGPVWGCLALAAFAMDAQAQAPKINEPDSPELTDKTLEDLLNTEVTIVSGNKQKVSQAAAAVYVITNEDIRRSGATAIPEALRMAPGLDVARIDSSRWAVSSRGFNDFFANKLLVLMDGRSVYTPLFSGVFWDVQDTMLEDIDQIEIIRGPGASIWGANAVNGVINIVSKNSKDTQGALVTGGGGTEERGFAAVRYGGKISDSLHYRAYVKYFARDDTRTYVGGEGIDEWDMYRGGFRLDWDITKDVASMRFQGDVYSGYIGQILPFQPRPVPPAPVSVINPAAPPMVQGRGPVQGGNLLSSYERVFSDTSDMTFQVYYDRTERVDQVHSEERDTYDVDFQHRFEALERNSVTWGLGYRYTPDDLRDGKAGTRSLLFPDAVRHDQLVSGFAQDEIELPKDVTLTLGAKVEHNDYTGFEFQPSARALWNPTETQSVWGSVSRAVRTPNRAEADIAGLLYSSRSPVGIDLSGSNSYDSEEVIAYELGYRWQATRKLSLDIAAFYNDYDDLRTIEDRPLTPLPNDFIFANSMQGETYGFETGANFQVTDAWRLGGSYTFLRMHLETTSPRADPTLAGNTMGDSPRHQFQVRSLLDLPFDLQFDTMLYYVDVLPARGVSSYFKLDARLGWSPCKNFDLSIVGQNLIEDHHREFGPGFLVSPNEIERSVYVKATWRF